MQPKESWHIGTSAGGGVELRQRGQRLR